MQPGKKASHAREGIALLLHAANSAFRRGTVMCAFLCPLIRRSLLNLRESIPSALSLSAKTLYKGSCFHLCLRLPDAVSTSRKSTTQLGSSPGACVTHKSRKNRVSAFFLESVDEAKPTHLVCDAASLWKRKPHFFSQKKRGLQKLPSPKRPNVQLFERPTEGRSFACSAVCRRHALSKRFRKSARGAAELT
ncbi:hypothetical protein TGRUB_429140 [Toxoplasma gondii RUB]|uniref:Uncharacterized protein n=1 Tax=Toxoplasma gondii RUB TaxID=935652 RepID=A0A086M869_TOXGO|nr:hypothetical protein TGRUB_429140 [Toxoplasma gondii RUB]